MCLAILQLKREAQRLSCLQRHCRAATLRRDRAVQPGCYGSTFLNFVLEEGNTVTLSLPSAASRFLLPAPDQHSAFRLRTRGLLPKAWCRILKEEDADVQFVKYFSGTWVTCAVICTDSPIIAGKDGRSRRCLAVGRSVHFSSDHHVAYRLRRMKCLEGT